MKCPNCEKADLTTAEVSRKVRVGARTYISQVPAETCPNCKAHFIDGEGAIRADLFAALHLAENGPVTGEGFAFIRQALGLQAQELAPLIDRSVGQVSRWERGHVAVDRSTWALLGAVVSDRLAGRTATIDRLRQLGRKRRVPSTVRLSVPPLESPALGEMPQ